MSETAKNGYQVAYFSMEVGIDPDLPTYSGGLGILAGDTIKSAADLELPFVAVTLISRKGYFRQEIDATGGQVEQPMIWDPADRLVAEKATVTVPIEGRKVLVRAWRLDYRSPMGGTVPVFFLDTDLPQNTPADREITQYLYGGDTELRLKADVVLGMGGFRMLEELGIEVQRFHLNEGHASFLTFELLHRTKRDIEKVWDEKSTWDFEAVRKRVIFTTHTPVAAGHDRFPYDLMEKVLGQYIPLDVLRVLAGKADLNTTLLAMNLSGFINGVAKKHREVSRTLFQGYPINAVTNGVHSMTWTHERIKQVFDRYIAGWREEPNLLAWVDKVPDTELWDAHQGAKRELLDHVCRATGTRLDLDVLTIGFARRATGYKRMDLIFHDPELLRRIGGGKLQFVFAGKAHPHDQEGKEIIRVVHRWIAEFAGSIKAVYLPNYDMRLAMTLIPGVDLWLNTPLRPLEASGTSGMKAAHNGVPNFSVLDGWWIEGHIEGLTGWSIGQDSGAVQACDPQAETLSDAADLYRKLEHEIIPLYYDDIPGWVRVMKGAIGKNAYYFNAHRMMRRYVTEAYFRILT